MGKLASLTTDPSGRFVTKVELGSLGCTAAAIDDNDSGQLWISADLEERVIEPGQGMPPILTRAAYTYTTTSPSPAPSAFPGAGSGGMQPEPTMVISPPSGPCDTPLEARGSGFPLPRAPTEIVELYLVHPGTSDVNMRILNAASIEPDGTFTARLGPAEPRCQAAALDSKAEQPAAHLLIAATTSLTGPPVPPGEPIPDIIAVARYAYTTTTLRIPTETLVVFPPSGPCDATIEVTGSGFEPAMKVRLDLGAPGSDASLGTLASVVAHADGRFAVEVSLGELGCRAAQGHMIAGDPSRRELAIWAFEAAPSTPSSGIPAVLAGAGYTFTTTEVTATPSGALPVTGSGPASDGAHAFVLPLLAGLAAIGLLAVAACIYARQRGT